MVIEVQSNISRVGLIVGFLLSTCACSSQSPARPSATEAAAQTASGVSPDSPSATAAAASVSLTTPAAISPDDGQAIKYTDQPVTLTVKNAVTTGSTPLTYTFQVAKEAGFGAVVASKSGVTAGANGQTSVNIDKLAGGATYFWRAQVASGGQGGPFTKVRSFVIGPEIVLQAPAPVSPGQNGTLTGTALLTVNNAVTSGPVGQLTYRFEISDSSSFGRIVFSGTTPEQAGQTSIQAPASLLTSGATYYWRAQATDAASGVASPLSSVFSFRFIAFDMSQAVIVDNPPDLASWAQTANITSVVFGPGQVTVDFDRRDGANRWPDSPWGAPGDSVEYTLGMCLNIGGRWYCSAAIQYWHGRDLQATDTIGSNWFYPPAWGPMNGYNPSSGELVGFFVAAGSVRHDVTPGGTSSVVRERSNVALTPWGQDYAISGSGVSTLIRRSRK